MSETIKADEFRTTLRALRVIDAALSRMRPAELAALLGISESTWRLWRSRPETRISTQTARQLRRLERRLR